MDIEYEEVPIDNEKRHDIFHYFYGGYYYNKKEKLYFFMLHTQPNKKEVSYYITDSCVLIADPGYDATFKVLFLNNPALLQNFLNSIYFEDNNMKLTNLEYLVGEYNEIGAAYNLNNLRSDIACKAKANMDKDILIDIEIQINWIDNLENRLFEYGSLLRNMDTKTLYLKDKEKNKNSDNKIKIKKIYNDTIVIAFILDKNNMKNSSKIELANSQNNNDLTKTTLNGFKIVEINVNKELDEMERNNKVILFNHVLSKDGADWLKLIGLRFWAEKYGDPSFGKYIFPKLKNGATYSKNQYLNSAIMSLIDESQINLTFYSKIEDAMEMQYNEGKKEGIEKGGKQKELLWAYRLFTQNQKGALKCLQFDYKYNMNEIHQILNNINDQQSLDQFIKYLKDNNYIS